MATAKAWAGWAAKRLASVALGPLLLAFFGWALAPWAWLVVPVLVAAATEALTWSLEPGPERQLVRPAGWAGASWLGWAWLASPLDPYVLLGLLGLSLLWLGLWWAYGRLLRMAEKGTSVEKNVVPAVLKGWDETAEALRLGGVAADLVDENEDVAHLRLTLPRGVLTSHVVGQVPLLEGAFSLRPSSLRAEPDLDRADRCHLFLVRRDPLLKPTDYPEATSAGTITDPLVLGVSSDTSLVRLTLGGKHVLVCGIPDAGKSMLMNVAVAEACRPNVVLWGIDAAKKGLELGPWNRAAGSQVFDRLAISTEAAVEMLADVLAVQQARAGWMADQGIKDWPNTPEHPRLLVFIDEFTHLIDAIGSATALEMAAMTVRQQGINLFVATQRVTADALGKSTAFRDLCDIRIAMKVKSRTQSVAIMGADDVANGWVPHELGSRRQEVDLPGLMLVSSPQHRLPRPGRCFYLPVERIGPLARELAPRLARLDDISRAALATPRPLRVETVDPAEALIDRMLVEAPEDGTETGAFERAVAELPPAHRRSERTVRDRLAARGERVSHGRWRARRAAAEEIA